MPQAVIMAGGQGERFWPLTHKAFPKYRLRFNDSHSLLEGTVKRLRSLYKKEEIHIVTTREHVALIRKELPNFPDKNIIIEPLRRNTAAAIFLTCAKLAHRYGPNEIVSFFPADHLIQNVALFKKTLQSAIRAAREKEMLVTVGIHPTFPATGYGYILAGKKIAGVGARKVVRFVEKPDRKTAERYLKAKKYFWNGGIFTWKAGALLETMRRTSPAYAGRFDWAHITRTYHKLPNVSIDVALLEKARNIAVVPARMDWCDLGSWDMFLEKSTKDKSSNCLRGKNIVCQDAHGNLVVSTRTDKPLVVLGGTGLLVVQTDRGTLVCPKGRSEEAALLAKNLARLSSRGPKGREISA